jgi:hypothetical protein
MPRVSVVIPFYNAQATIAETLASLDAQHFRDFDVTIVDDGSTAPEARATLDALPQRFRVVRQENRGLPGARNAGIAASAGELVLPLDSDDLLAPDAIAKLVAALDRDASADLAFSWTMRFDEEDGLSQMALHPVEQLFVNEAPYCMLMRRGLVQRAGGYDETMREGYEDWEFNIRLVGLGARAAIAPEPLFRYRVRQRGMLKSRTMGQHVQIWRAIRARHRDLYAPGAIWRAWRGARGQRHIWPMPALLGWGLLLLACPPALFNPAYRAIVAATRGLRDRYKARAHGTG